MKLPSVALLLACAALTSSAAFSPSAPADPVDFTFRSEAVNSKGVKSLADLRGKPVVIDFWGRR